MSKLEENEELNYEDLKEDEENEWWRPTKKDGFNLTNKLLRTGCRPVKRKYFQCIRQDAESFGECQRIKEDMNKCVQMLKYIYATKAD